MQLKCQNKKVKIYQNLVKNNKGDTLNLKTQLNIVEENQNH